MDQEYDRKDEPMNEYCFGHGDSSAHEGSDSAPWKIIIADDEKDVHTITRMVLADFRFEGRGLAFLNAYSGRETKHLVEQNPDAAILLLDVVMETPDSGLDVVHHIRKHLNNRILQIVLRTGQPSHVPEREIIETYGINDYRSKAEITSQKLFNIITVLLRAYRQASSYQALNEHLKKELDRRARVEEALRRIQDELESRVVERTAELSLINKRLVEEIEERKKAEIALHRSEDRLRHASKMEAIGTLAGGIAHDFNNILAAIVLNAEMALVEMSDHPEAAYSLEQVLNSSRRARELVDQILTFSRSTPQERKPLKMLPVVEETLRMLRAILPSTIRIDKRLSTGCGWISAGAPQIQQLVMNLCNNAAQAMKTTGGTIEVILDEIEFDTPEPDHGIPTGVYVRLAVQDAGSGIDAEIMPYIFDPFFTTKAPGEGTGLGLSVVHGIVVGNEGYITVESEPGKGARFDVYFPRISEIDMRAIEETRRAPTGAEDILLIDDEEGLVQAGRKALEHLGYRVTAITDPVEAIECFAKQPGAYAMVITDMTMPGMTGLDLSRRILSVRRDVPILLCTGFNSLITREKALSMGIRDMIMKPFTTDSIATVMRRILDQGRKTG